MGNQLLMNDSEFSLYQRFIYDTCGINLTPQKKSLLVSRLEKRILALNLGSFRAYRDFVSSPSGKKELLVMLTLITTNKTNFFREPAHFDFLTRTVFPKIFQKQKIRIWSAGCSTGEEPYTLSITLHESNKNLALHDIKILATDLSTRVLEEASQGIYSEERLQNVPFALRKKYFLKGTKKWGGSFAVKDEIKKLIRFRLLNFMDPFPFHGKFDAIFCRNVMIYFDKPTQGKLVEKFVSFLEPGGYFFIGHSETLNSLNTRLRYIQPTVYQHY